MDKDYDYANPIFFLDDIYIDKGGVATTTSALEEYILTQSPLVGEWRRQDLLEAFRQTPDYSKILEVLQQGKSVLASFVGGDWGEPLEAHVGINGFGPIVEPGVELLTSLPLSDDENGKTEEPIARFCLFTVTPESLEAWYNRVLSRRSRSRTIPLKMLFELPRDDFLTATVTTESELHQACREWRGLRWNPDFVEVGVEALKRGKRIVVHEASADRAGGTRTAGIQWHIAIYGIGTLVKSSSYPFPEISKEEITYISRINDAILQAQYVSDIIGPR
jgi:hypothetical protein